jgi:hypothetical protein
LTWVLLDFFKVIGKVVGAQLGFIDVFAGAAFYGIDLG